MYKQLHRVISCLAVSGLVLIPGFVSAAPWRVSPGVTVSERYSDNDNLSATDKKSKAITMVSPDISLSGSGGGRIDYDLLAALRHNQSSDGENSTTPSLNGDASAELIEQILFFDVSSTINQNRRDPFQATGDDDISRSRSDNVTTTYSYTLSPYLLGHINTFADMELRYSFDEQFNSQSDVGDSSRQALSFNLSSGRDFSVFDWGLVGNTSKTHADNGFQNNSFQNNSFQNNDNELKSADLRSGYRLNRKLRLRSSVGREWNDFQSVRSDIDGKRWDFGAIWTPNKRTSVDIGYGERFFGSTPSVDITYRKKKNVFTLGYKKELTDARTLRRQRGLFDEDLFGNPIDPTTAEPIFVFPGEGQIVDERVSFSWSRQGKRTTLTWRGDHSTQNPQNSLNEVIFVSSSIDLSRRLTSKLSFDTGVDWEDQTNESDAEFQTWRFNMGLSRAIGSKSNVNLRYTYTDRGSDFPGDGYEENRLIVNYRINL